MNYLFSVRAVDLNNDGKLDLIVGFNGGIGTMLGNGDGTFTMKQSITTPGSATFLAPGDLNGDGFMDVAVATQGSGIYIFTGNGDGTLTQGTGISGNIPSVFAVDFNGDGRMDLVYTVTSVGTYLALGNGDGTFISSSLSTPLNANLAVADFNGDGLPDVAAISSGGSAVLYGSLTSPLATSTASRSTTANSQFIAALDLNGDGVPDLAAINSTAYVLLSSLAHTSTATLANASPAGSGVHQVDASYPGDSNYGASVSATQGLTAQIGNKTITFPQPTTPVAPGTTQTLAATASNGDAITYSITSGTATLSGSNITYTTLGTVTIAANSAATASYNAAPQVSRSVTLAYIATTTTLTATPSTAGYGSIITLTATVSNTSATGTVTFHGTNGASIGTAALTNGVATLSATSLPIGVNSVTATYQGDGTYGPSTSAPATVTITVATTAVGSTSGTQQVAMNFTSTATLNSTLATAVQVLTQGAPNLDYKYVSGGTCAAGATYTSGQSCTVDFTFAPLAPGQRLGAVQLYTNDATPALAATSFVAGVGTSGLAAFTGSTAETNLASGFSSPQSVAVAANGDVFVAATGNSAVKKIAAGTGTVTTITSGLIAAGLTVDGAGNVFVADAGNSLVREVVAVNGVVSSGSPVVTVGSGFNATQGIWADGSGNVFVADYGNNAIKEIVAVNGVVSSGSVVNTVGSGFAHPTNLAVDSSGNVFVADYGNNAVKEILATNGTVTAASTVITVGSGFTNPADVVVDAAGNVFVADFGNSLLKEIVAVGGTVSSSSSVITVGTFSKPYGVGRDGSGDIFVADYSAGSVVKLNLTSPTALTFPSTSVGATSAAQNVAFVNEGNAALAVASVATSNTNFTASYGTCPTTLASGTTCALSFTFTPQTVGANTANGVVTDNTLNVTGSTQLVALSGTATQATKTITFPQPTTPAIVGTSATLTATASNADPVTYAVTGGTGTATIVGSTITYTSVGTVQITASSAATANYTAATPVVDTVAVVPAAPSYTAPTTAVGATSGTQTATVNITAMGGLSTIRVLAQGTTGYDYAFVSGGTCSIGTVYLAGQACTVEYTFSPKAPGTRLGAVALNAGTTAIGTSFLTGTGTGPLAAFSLGVTSTPITSLSAPHAIVVDPAGNVYVGDSGNNTVKKYAGGVGTGTAVGSGYNGPTGMCLDGAGTLYVTNFGGGNVITVTSAGVQSTLSSGWSGPAGCTVDGSGNVYVDDYSATRLYEVPGNGGPSAIRTLLATVASPEQNALDASGNIYVGTHSGLYKVPAGGGTPTAVTVSGFPLGVVTSVAFDAAQNLYIADQTNSRILEVPSGGGLPFVVETGNQAWGIAAASGNLYIASITNSNIALDTRSTGTPLNFGSVAVGGASSVQSPKLENDGNANLTFTSFGSSNGNFSFAGTTCTTGSPLVPGGLCAVSSLFAPSAVGAASATGTVTDNSLNVAGTTQTIALSGTGTPGTKTITFPQPPSQVAGTSYTLTATASNGDSVTYSITSGPATVSGNVVTYTGAGTVMIAANSAATANYAAAATVTDSVAITAAATSFIAPSTPVGSTSATQVAEVTFTTAGTPNAITVVTQGIAGKDFALVTGGTCSTGTAYTVGQSCTVQYTFAPITPGLRNGGIVVKNSSNVILASSFLSGTGNGPQGLFQAGVSSFVYSTTLNQPRSLTVDPAGNVYVANTQADTLLKFAASSTTPSTLATATANVFNEVVDGIGNVYYSTSAGIYELVGGAGTATLVNSSLTAADDNLSVDGSGNLYTTDQNTGAIYKIAAGTHTSSTLIAGGSGYRFVGMAIDSNGNLFAADYNNSKLYELVANASSLTLLYSGTPLVSPHAVAVDAAGDLYVSNVSGTYVYRFGSGNYGATPTTLAVQGQTALAIGADGSLYTVTGNTLTQYTRITLPTLAFASTAVGATSASQSAVFENDGNTPLTISSLATSNTNFSVTTPATPCSTSSALAVAATCLVAADFTPRTAGADTANYVVTDNSLNVATSTQSVPLSGTATVGTKTITFPQPTTPAFVGTTATLTATASDGDAVTYAIGGGSTATATYAGAVVTYSTPGTLNITANSAASANASAAAPVTDTVTVYAVPVITSPSSGAALPVGNNTVSGTAPPSSAVTIYDNGTSIASGTASAGGAFSITASLGYGTHSLTAKATVSGVTSPASTAVSVTVIAPATYTAPTTNVGSTSATQTVYVTFTTAGTPTAIDVLTQGTAGLDYAYVSGGTCSTSTAYTLGQTCTVQYTFRPAAPGQRLGAVQLVTGTTVLGTSLLAGTGIGPAVVFPTTGVPIAVGSGFNQPEDAAVDAAGNLYVVDTNNTAVKKVAAGTGIVTTIGSGFGYVNGVAVDGAGNVFVADFSANAAKEIVALGGSLSSTSAVVTLSSSFNHPYGIAVDAAGDVFVADSFNNAVKEIAAVNGSIPASPTITTVGSNFSTPLAVSVDASGNEYVADSGHSAIKEIIAVSGAVSSGSTVNTLGSGFSSPRGVYADAAGNVYVADTGNNSAKEILAVGGTIPASNPTILTLATGLNSPSGISVSGAGNVYVADTGNSAIKQLPVTTAPSLTFGSTAVGSASAAQNLLMQNVGNASLAISSIAPSSSNYTFAGAVNGSYAACSTTLASSGVCNISATFTPQTSGSPSANGVVTDNNLNANNSTQTVTLSGTSTYAAPTVTSITPTYGPPAGGTTVTITGTNLLGATAINFGATAATSFSVISDTSITAVSPAGSGTVDISVTTPAATSATSVADQFAYQATQTIAFTQPTTPAFVGSTDTLSATGGGSSNPVTFSIVSGTATLSDINNSTITYTTAGTVVIAANQAGNSSYTAATQVTRTVAVIPQSIVIINSGGSVTTDFDNGTPQTSNASGGGIGAAVDASGNVWSVYASGAGVSKFTDTGTLAANYTASSLTSGTALAIDGNGTVWVAQGGTSNNVFAISNTGAVLSTTGFGQAANLSNPASITVNAAGSLWIANQGNGTITEVIGVAVPVTTPTVQQVISQNPGAKP